MVKRIKNIQTSRASLKFFSRSKEEAVHQKYRDNTATTKKFKGCSTSDGFSLIEVMIALAIFAFMSTAMIFSVINNVTGSMQMERDLSLHNLAELKMNEVLIREKKFTNATANDPDTGNFEIEGYKDYSFKVEIIPNKFPDFSQIMGKTDEEADSDTSSIQKKIFNKLKENMEKMIWQVKVSVYSPAKDETYELTSWINNDGAKVDTNFGL